MIWIAVLAALGGDDPPVREAPQAASRASSGALFDFRGFEAAARGGIVWFSENYEADPEPCAGLLMRAPMPWLSRGLFGFSEDRFGFFVSATASQIDRGFEPPFQQPDGTLLFGNAGVDFSLARSDSFVLATQAGAQYADYGDVSRLENGVGFVTGLRTGVRIARGLWLTYDADVVFAHAGDKLVFNFLSLTLGF
jgi:hypothetical protein